MSYIVIEKDILDTCFSNIRKDIRKEKHCKLKYIFFYDVLCKAAATVAEQDVNALAPFKQGFAGLRFFAELFSAMTPLLGLDLGDCQRSRQVGGRYCSS